MPRRMKSTFEFAISEQDLTRAIHLWFDRMTLGLEFQITKVEWTPGEKFAARVTIKPPDAGKKIAAAVASPEPVT